LLNVELKYPSAGEQKLSLRRIKIRSFLLGSVGQRAYAQAIPGVVRSFDLSRPWRSLSRVRQALKEETSE